MNHELNEDRIERIIEQGFSFSPTDFISKAFTLVNKNAGMFIGFIIVYGIISSLLSNVEQKIFGGFNLSILTTILQALLIPGFFIVARRVNQGKQVEFKHFFEGTKKAGNLIGVAVLVRVFTTIPFIPALVSLFMNDDIIEQLAYFYAGLPEGEINLPVISMLSSILLLVAFLGSIYVGIIYFFAVPLVYFTNLSVWQAMETSRKVASTKIFSILGLSILQFLLILLGILMLVIGVVYMAPVAIVATYVAFDAVFKLEAEEDEIEITDHFVG